MLERTQKLAIFMEGHANDPMGKMGHGVIRYSPNPIVCVIDSENAGKDMKSVANMPKSVPIVASVREAMAMGADVLVLGIAPPGGLIPATWFTSIDEAVSGGVSILNGLHDLLGPRYSALKPGQWVWDVRVEPAGLTNSSAAASKLANRRLLMVGTDMAVGKMTSGLEIHRVAKERGIDAEFVATRQIGITVTGRGVPLDAIRLDFAPGSIEGEVMRTPNADLIVVEGQGSIIHPASSATLPLIRGSCPTHFILCHRAGQEHLFRVPSVKIPRLSEVARLYEDIAEACGTFARPKTVAVCLNTFHISSDQEAAEACRKIEVEMGIPCVDPVRHGAQRLVDAVMA